MPIRCAVSYAVPRGLVAQRLTSGVAVEAVPGQAFELHETGWGEFEVTIKLYYDPVSQEKPQSFYHHLRLHPYGETEADKEKMRQQDEIVSLVYEEQVFGEPYEAFFDLLTGGSATGSNADAKDRGGGKSKKGSERDKSGDGEQRTALIPLGNRPGVWFSRESERAELMRLETAREQVAKMRTEIETEVRNREEELKNLKEEVMGKRSGLHE